MLINKVPLDRFMSQKFSETNKVKFSKINLIGITSLVLL